MPGAVRDLGTGALLPFTLSAPDGLGPVLTVELAAPTDELPRTIELVLTAEPTPTQDIVQVPGAPLRLDVWNAKAGAGDSLRWNFTMATPCQYRVVLLSKETFGSFNPQWWADGMSGILETQAGRTPFTLHREDEEECPVLHYWKIIRSEIGPIHLSRTGEYELSIEDLPVVDSKWDRDGVNMIALRLEPVDEASPASPGAGG